MADEFTQHLNLPLPAAGNMLSDDVLRLRDALSMLDAAVNAKAEAADINAALAQLVDSAPAAMDSLRELAQALGNNPDFAAQVAAQITAIQSSITAIQQALATKADATAVNNALATKADASSVNTALATKADAADLQLKANAKGLRGEIYFMGSM